MTIQHLFPLSIYILYCVAIIHGILLDISNNEICSVLCKKCNASAVFVNNRCECDFNDNNEDVECIQSLQSILTYLNVLSDNLANKERSIRSALKSRRRLRIGDAEKVAQYFTNGGASAGHSHFIRGSNAVCDNTNTATNSLSGTIRQSEFHPRLPINPLTGIIYKSYKSPLHMLPGAAPMIPGTKMYTSFLGMVRPISGYPVDRMYPLNPVSDSISLVHTHPYHVLLQTSALPSHILHNLMTHHSHYPPIHRNNDKTPYPQQDNSPTIPFVGQPYGNNNNFNHQASSNSLTTGNNTNESVHNSSARTAAQMNVSHLPMQYKHIISPYRFIPYYSPLLNILYSPFDKFIIESIPHYFQHASDSTLTSLQNPDTYRTNNTTTELQAEVPTTVTNETGYFNDEQTEKADDTTEHYTSVSKEQNET